MMRLKRFSNIIPRFYHTYKFDKSISMTTHIECTDCHQELITSFEHIDNYVDIISKYTRLKKIGDCEFYATGADGTNDNEKYTMFQMFRMASITGQFNRNKRTANIVIVSPFIYRAETVADLTMSHFKGDAVNHDVSYIF